MPAITSFLSRGQGWFYLLAAVLGLCAPGLSPHWLLEPAVGVLIFLTFAALPLSSFTLNWAFAWPLVVLNFLVAPVVVAALCTVLPDAPVRVAVALVLLCPCVDYVVVFTSLAGGAAAKLAAHTPVLLLGQLLVVPLLLPTIAGARVEIDHSAVVQSFGVLIVLPFVLAVVAHTAQAWWRKIQNPHNRAGAWRFPSVHTAADALMVPVMMVVLFALFSTFGPQLRQLGSGMWLIIGVFAAFAVVMAVAALVLSALTRTRISPPVHSCPDTIAHAFSAVTRNSLVVMPIALALGPQSSAIVATQTLVEVAILLAMTAAINALKRSAAVAKK